MEAWLQHWTPEAIVQTTWQLGAPMIVLIGLMVTLARHGWPWRPKK